MNDLEKIFYSNKGGTIHKWKHYLEIYERHFSKYKNKEVVILEIGVFQGGSLRMWKEYFGKNAKIYGLDINPECKKLEENGIEILIGSQEDRNFLKKIKKIIPKVDILIEDGGHMMNQQIITFEELYDHVKSDGIYLCEDMHTSYWRDYGGGYKSRGTFVEYSKNFIDYLNAWHSKQKSFNVNYFTKNTFSVHYYDSVVVLEKRKMNKPKDLSTGKDILPPFNPQSSRNLIQIIWNRIRNEIRFRTRV
jgi:23S rRNA U2552 (ribose-2'-O)-methylase RlmE/FtsJ